MNKDTKKVKIPHYDFPKEIKFNSKHSEYPDAPILKVALSELKPVQGTIMEIKIEGIMNAINEKVVFDPFILHPGTYNIFDGHHRYHAFMNYISEELANKFIVPYIELVNNETEVQQVENVGTNTDVSKEIRETNQELKDIVSNFMKDSPATTETPGFHEPVHEKPINDKPENKVVEENIKPKETDKNMSKESIDDCVSRKIPIIADEHPDMEHDQIVAIAFEICRENLKIFED